jgi:hypothetical protein
MSQVKETIIIKEETTNQNSIKEKLNNICVHQWIEDYIDISPELSQNIFYCIKCETTKEQN